MPLARHDMCYLLCFRFAFAFLLTCLLRGMTFYAHSTHLPLLFLLTCLLRGMTSHALNGQLFAYVSTHMPLARHDADACLPLTGK